MISLTTATPAIGAALEALPDNAIGQAFIEVAGPEDEIALTAPAGVEVRWIYRGGRADLVPEDQAGDNAPLIEAVKEAAWLPGQVQVFIHGEAQPMTSRQIELRDRYKDLGRPLPPGYTHP